MGNYNLGVSKGLAFFFLISLCGTPQVWVLIRRMTGLKLFLRRSPACTCCNASVYLKGSVALGMFADLIL